MQIRPILFRPEMAQAIAENRKTQTRRPSKAGKDYFNVGDILWVKETWAKLHDCPEEYACPNEYPEESELPHFCTKRNCYVSEPCYKIYYKGQDPSAKYPGGWPADSFPPDNCRWESPLFMPRSHSRLTLEVTRVHAERLLSISKKDVLAEGFQSRDSFLKTWHSLYRTGINSLQSNPLVTVIEFHVV